MIQHKDKVAAGLRALNRNKMPAPALFLYMEYDCPPADDLFGTPVYPSALQLGLDESNLTEHVQFVPVWRYDTQEKRSHMAFMEVYCAAYCDAPERME